jgi:hypothetical protein
MDRPLKDHIAYLEQKIENLKAQHDDLDLTAGERYQAVIDLELAERALACFREARELEKKVQQISN